MNIEPKVEGFEQLTLDIDYQKLGGVVVRPTIEQVEAELDAIIETGLKKQQNEKLQGSLL